MEWDGKYFERLFASAAGRRLVHCLTLADLQPDSALRVGPAAVFYSRPARTGQGIFATELFRRWKDVGSSHGGLTSNLYLHLPFCRTNCRFCVYPHRLCGTTEELDRFTSGMLAALDFFAPATEGLVFSHLYLGGGTPIELGLRRLERICRALEKYRFKSGAGRGFYCVPASIDKRRAALLRSWGFDRASLGVISLQPAVLERMNCAHGSASAARRALEALQEAGFRANCQLVAGLWGEDERSLKKSVREVLSWQPDEITIYLPAVGTPTQALALDFFALESAVSLFRLIKEEVRASGYFGYASSATPAVRIVSAGTKNRLSGFSPWPRRPAHLFALGPGVQGHLAHRLHYRLRDEALETFAPNRVLADGVSLAGDEELRRLCATLLFEGRRFEPAELARRAAADRPDAVARDLDALCRLRLVRRAGRGYCLEKGLSRRLKYAAALYVVGEGKIAQVAEDDWPRKADCLPEGRWRRYLNFARKLKEDLQRGPVQYFYVAEREKPLALTPDLLAESWRRAFSDLARGRFPALVNFYLHVPFCRQRCRYCTYYSMGGASEENVATYLKRLRAEADYFSPRFRSHRFASLYIGGGTPSSLSLAQLRHLLRLLFSRFSFSADGERCFECNPDSLDEDKISLLAEHGFNRVSLGVQTFNRSVLTKVNRGYQTVEMVNGAVARLKKAGFWVNLDLILGLPGEAAASFLDSVRRALALEPEELTMTPLFSDTPAEVLAEAGGFGGWTASLFRQVAAECKRYGYLLQPSQFEVKAIRRIPSPARWEVARQRSYGVRPLEPCSLFALGPTARGYVYGRLWYRWRLWEEGGRFEPSAELIDGKRLSLEQEMRCHVMSTLVRRPPLKEKDFRKRFRMTLDDALAEDWAGLKRLGLLRCHRAGEYRLSTRSARLVFTAAMFIAGEPAVREARRWQIKMQTPSPPDLPAQQVEQDAKTLAEQRRLEEEKKKLDILKNRLVKIIPSTKVAEILPPGWTARLGTESCYVVLEAGPEGEAPLRIGLAEAGSQENFFCRSSDFDVAYLTAGGRDPANDPQARNVLEKVARALGAKPPERE